MNILLSFLQDHREQPHPVPAYRFWEHYIKRGIEEAGMQWSEIPDLDWAAGLMLSERDPEMKTWKAMTWERALKYVTKNRHRIDIFLCYLYPKQIDVHAIKEIKKLGIPCVNFFCDHVREFVAVPAEFKVFDLMWVPEFEALGMYKASKTSYIHLPMPVWVAKEFRCIPLIERDNISFIGSQDEMRQSILYDLITRGLPVEIRGDGWNINQIKEVRNSSVNVNQKIINQINLVRKSGVKGFAMYHLKKLEKSHCPPIPYAYIFGKPDFENYIKTTRESMITLGINRVPTKKRFNSNPLVYSRLRDLEAPMLGACYLTEYSEGLSVLYDLGKEIESYASVDELFDKCCELIRYTSKRNELRRNGQKRALSEHTIPQSLLQLKLKLFH